MGEFARFKDGEGDLKRRNVKCEITKKEKRGMSGSSQRRTCGGTAGDVARGQGHGGLGKESARA